MVLRLLSCLLFAAAALAQQPYRSLIIDASEVRGDIRFHTEATLNPDGVVVRDYAGYLAAFGDRTPDRVVIPVELGRGRQRPAQQAVPGANQGPSAAGWPVFPDESADAQDPASYDFRAVDAVLAAARAAGAAVVVRFDLGSTGAGANSLFADAARRVALHLNEGWAQGHGFRIKEWLVCDAGAASQGAPQAMENGNPPAAVVASAIVQTLQSLDPSSSVGRCFHWRDNSSGPAATLPFLEKRPQGSGLTSREPGYFSWVFAGAVEDAAEPLRAAERLRKGLDDAGHARIGLRLSTAEFGLSDAASSASDKIGSDKAGQAARLAAALVYLQDAPVRAIALDLWSTPSVARDEKRQAVLLAAAQLIETPQRLAAEGSDSIGYALLAGRSADRSSVQILIANARQLSTASNTAQPLASSGRSSNSSQPGFEAVRRDDNEGYDLEVANLPWGAADFGVYCYRVDGEHALDLIWEGGGRGGSLRLRRQLPAGSVDLVVLEQQDRPVYDRLPRRRERR
ncbi:MAG: hypothetical protein WD733_06780 [Bryobacterales bacterium]